MRLASFECPIQMQPKLVAVLPAVFLGVMIVGGWGLHILARRGLLAQSTSGMLGTVLFFVMIAGVLAVVLGGGGRVEVGPERIVVNRGLAGSVALPRAGADFELSRWRSFVHFSRWLEAGPQVRIRSGGRSVTIAAVAPDQAKGLPASGAFLMDLPDAVVDPEHFRELLGALEVEAAVPGGG